MPQNTRTNRLAFLTLKTANHLLNGRLVGAKRPQSNAAVDEPAVEDTFAILFEFVICLDKNIRHGRYRTSNVSVAHFDS